MNLLSAFDGIDRTGKLDSTAAIQAGLNALSGQQVDVMIDGSYLISPTGLIKPPGINLLARRKGGGELRAMAGTYSNGLLSVRDQSSFYIGGVQFDYSAATAAPQSSVVTVVGCSDFEIEECVINGEFIFGLGMGGISAARIRHNRITLTEGRNDQNEAILAFFTGYYPANSDVKIEDNTLANSGTDLTLINSDITGNSVTGWKFGAGITTEDNALNSYNLTIGGNRISGGIGKDTNGTVMPGIENWAPGSRISGNMVFGNAGTGISNAVANCIVSGNHCYGNGGSGLASELERAINSHWLGNHSYGNTRFGYEDGFALTGMLLDGNCLVTNTLGVWYLTPPEQYVIGTNRVS